MFVDVRGVALGDGFGGVGGVSIDHDDLGVRVGLSLHRLQAGFERGGGIAGGYDDGNKRRGRHTALVYQIMYIDEKSLIVV